MTELVTWLLNRGCWLCWKTRSSPILILCPFFFFTRTIFASHVGYRTSLMKPAQISLSTSASICAESSLSSQLSSLSVGSGEAIVEKLSSFVIYGWRACSSLVGKILAEEKESQKAYRPMNRGGNRLRKRARSSAEIPKMYFLTLLSVMV